MVNFSLDSEGVERVLWIELDPPTPILCVEALTPLPQNI